MRLKKFLKRMNRGIFLGIAVLVGFIIYVMVDKAVFANDKPGIESMIQNYYSEMGELSVTPKELQSFNAVITDEVMNQKTQKINEVLDKYWVNVDTINTDYGYNNKSFMLNQYSNSSDDILFKKNSNSNGYITKWTGKLTIIKIQKNGPDMAKAICSYDSTSDYAGQVSLFAPDNQKHYYDNLDYDPQTGMPLKNQSEKIATSSANGKCCFYLKKDNGDWKIAYCNAIFEG